MHGRCVGLSVDEHPEFAAIGGSKVEYGLIEPVNVHDLDRILPQRLLNLSRLRVLPDEMSRALRDLLAHSGSKQLGEFPVEIGARVFVRNESGEHHLGVLEYPFPNPVVNGRRRHCGPARRRRPRGVIALVHRLRDLDALQQHIVRLLPPERAVVVPLCHRVLAPDIDLIVALVAVLVIGSRSVLFRVRPKQVLWDSVDVVSVHPNFRSVIQNEAPFPVNGRKPRHVFLVLSVRNLAVVLPADDAVSDDIAFIERALPFLSRRELSKLLIDHHGHLLRVRSTAHGIEHEVEHRRQFAHHLAERRPEFDEIRRVVLIRKVDLEHIASEHLVLHEPGASRVPRRVQNRMVDVQKQQQLRPRMHFVPDPLAVPSRSPFTVTVGKEDAVPILGDLLE